MENFVIIAIALAVLAAAIFYSVKHFRGEGGCCGGGGYKPRRKRLSGVKYQKTFKVGGMHCAHCKGRVEEAVNDIRGVAGRADLKRGELTVLYAEEVPDEVIKAKIERAGYTLL